MVEQWPAHAPGLEARATMLSRCRSLPGQIPQSIFRLTLNGDVVVAEMFLDDRECLLIAEFSKSNHHVAAYLGAWIFRELLQERKDIRML